MAQHSGPTVLEEDISKRDYFTKHYELSNGNYQAVISGGPVHYEDQNGQLLDIQQTITSSQGQFSFENSTNLFNMKFPSEIGLNGVSVGQGDSYISFGSQASIKALSISGELLLNLESAQSNEIEVNDNKASYPLFSIAQSEYIVGNGELKNNLILEELPSNIPAGAEYITFTETLRMPQGWKLVGEGEEITSKKIIGSGVGIFNSNNELMYQIPVPDVYEELHPDNAIYADGNWRASYQIEEITNGVYEFSTLVPVSWLTDQQRQFPVVIDPTITVAGSLGGWQNSNSAYNDATFYVFTANNYSSTTYRAWTKWNISSIPTGSIVLNSEVQMYCNGGVAGVDTINVNDVTGTYGNYGQYNSSAYADFANGNYIQFVTNGTAQNYGYYDLGTTCDGDIEDEIGNTWFQLAFTMAPGTSNWKRFTATSSYLRVEYVQCSGQLGGSVTTSGMNNFGHHVDCYGDTTASVTAVGSGGSTYTYTWSGPNGYSSTNGTISNVGAGQYSVTIYSGTICPAYVDTMILSPEQLFINDSTSSYSGYTVSCFDESDGEIYLNPTGSSGSYSYSWSGPSSFTSTSQNLTGLEKGMYHVTLTEGNVSCSIVDSVNMLSPGLLEINVIETSDAYCEFDENGSAEVNAVGGVQAYTYLWDNGETTATPVMLPAGQRTVTATDANGCESDVNVEIGFEFAAPDVDLGGPDTGYCTDGSVLLNPGGGFASYLWSDGSTGQLLQVSGLGTYSVTCTTIGGCEGEDAINVSEEFDLPEPDLGGNVNSPTSPVILTPGVYSAYVWSTGSLDSAITVSVQGTYSVSVTDNRGCKGEDEVNVKFWTVGIDDDFNSEQVKLYPNPASEIINVEGQIEGNSTLNLINAQGQLVRQMAISNSANKSILNVADLPSGVYFIELTDENSNWKGSFIKN
ncbi:T9SS type A sorting domain-containing protein [Salibacteraceae bacterium]|nr:T9SS type A sorting domain-containing protein [Salibacteraceae bacterium]